MKAKVFIIEDEADIAQLVSMYVQREGIECRVFPDAETADEALREEQPDLIVLDLNLPGMDGFELLQRLRKHEDTPVIILSARDADEDVILGLGIGADDYVTKPFSPRILIARVRAHLRRAAVRPVTTTVEFGPFSWDGRSLVLRDGERVVEIPPRERSLLAFLIRNEGRTVSAETIYREVWNREFGDMATVAVHIQRLRRRLNDDPAHPRFIHTEYGLGYRFDPAKERRP